MKKVEKIRTILSSEFEIKLLDASIASLNDKGNKLRYNNFAYSIRELSRHFLRNLSPDEKIKQCPWFKKETCDGKPSRRQRIKYAIQGGLTDGMLKESGLDIDELEDYIKSISDTINELSKYTHINEEVFDLKDSKVDKMSQQVLSTFADFVKMINSYREFLKQFLDGHIDEHILTSIISSFFETVDQLAPRHSIEYTEVHDYNISEINDGFIVVDVSGFLHVTLEYGSNKERREGDGLDISESFPFETKIKYEISEKFPSDKYSVDEYDVDTSSWYE